MQCGEMRGRVGIGSGKYDDLGDFGNGGGNCGHARDFRRQRKKDAEPAAEETGTG